MQALEKKQLSVCVDREEVTDVPVWSVEVLGRGRKLARKEGHSRQVDGRLGWP